VLLLLFNLVGFFIFKWHKSVKWKCFVPQLYQLRRGISGGPAFKYFYTMHGAYCGGNSRRQVVNVFSTGFGGNGCEQVLNSHLNAEASQSLRRLAPQAIFVLRVGTKSYRVGERLRVTFQRYFYLISDPQKRGVYVTFVWWWIYLRPCERVCV